MSTVSEDFKQLVYVRMQALPDGTEISIGGDRTLSKSELLEHIEAGDEIGQKIIEIEKHFFEMLKSGSIYEEIA